MGVLAISDILYRICCCFFAVPDKFVYFGTETFLDKEAYFVDRDDGVFSVMLPQDFMLGCNRYKTLYVSHH